MIANDIVSSIGHTPLVEVVRLSPNPAVHLYVKMEGNNPAGSIKDRIARSMIEKAEADGRLTHDRTILEATSGNTGIALAMIAKRKGYRITVVMPENVSIERQKLLRYFGAEIVLSEGKYGTNGAIEVAYGMARDDRYFMPDQFGNPANPQAHYETTGVEILHDLPAVDVLVAGLGTGGTVMGTGRRLREVNPATKVIAVEPYPGDPIQGLRSLSEGFIPSIVDVQLIDERCLVTGAEAVAATRVLMESEGIFAGLSAGAVIDGALKAYAKLEKGNVVAILPDAGWKYLSMNIWNSSGS